MKSKKIKSSIFVCIAILVSSCIRAIGIHSFILPNNFAPGGVTGIASMIQFKSGINAGYFIFALNLPLLVLAIKYINKSFALKTLASTVLTSALLIILEKVKFVTYVSANQSILAAIAGGIFGGAGLAIMLKIGGSSGGTDIIATLIQKKFSATNVAWFIFLLDAVVVLASFFVYNSGLEPVLLALSEMFVSSKVCETIMQGFKSALKFEIITPNPEELSKEILEKLERGVTCIPAIGMYSHDEKSLLICVVRKRQIAQFQKILKKYPESFAYISSSSEVMGYGFSS